MTSPSTLPPCAYGSLCYRKNLEHYDKFSHPPGHKGAAVAGKRNQRETEDGKLSRPKKKRKKPHAKETSSEGTDPIVIDKSSDPPVSQDKEKRVDSVAKEEQAPQQLEPEPEVGPSSSSVTGGTAHATAPTLPPPLSLPLWPDTRTKWLAELSRLYDGMVFPETLLDVWLAALQINKDNPCSAFATSAGVVLCGPFDVLAGTFHNTTKAIHYHAHQRFNYDPPEAQTVFKTIDDTTSQGKGKKSKPRHWVYWRDEPLEAPAGVYVCENDGYKFSAGDDTVLGALVSQLRVAAKATGSDKTLISKHESILITIASGSDAYPKATTSIKAIHARGKQVRLSTFLGTGIVVGKDQWRDLPIHVDDLKKLLTRIRDSNGNADTKDKDELGEALTWSDISNDEGDFGMGYAIGHNLWAFSLPYPTADSTEPNPLTSTMHRTLGLAYALLNRMLFDEILEGMESYRRPEENPHVEG